MKYVYLRQSVSHPKQRYVGLTNNLQRRIATHNQGDLPHSTKYAPWQIEIAIRINDDRRAAAFERYLKTGSGRTFATRPFW